MRCALLFRWIMGDTRASWFAPPHSFTVCPPSSSLQCPNDHTQAGGGRVGRSPGGERDVSPGQQQGAQHPAMELLVMPQVEMVAAVDGHQLVVAGLAQASLHNRLRIRRHHSIDTTAYHQCPSGCPRLLEIHDSPGRVYTRYSLRSAARASTPSRRSSRPLH